MFWAKSYLILYFSAKYWIFWYSICSWDDYMLSSIYRRVMIPSNSKHNVIIYVGISQFTGRQFFGTELHSPYGVHFPKADGMLHAILRLKWWDVEGIFDKKKSRLFVQYLKTLRKLTIKIFFDIYFLKAVVNNLWI